MSKLKYFSFLLAIGLFMNSCVFNFDQKEKEDSKEPEENKEDVVRIEVNGEEMTIDADELEEEISKGVNQMVKELTESLEGVGDEWNEGEDVELMDHRELKSMLPDRVGWMKQTEHSSEKSGVLGFRIASAEAKYESKDKWIEIELTDLGGMPIARMGLSFLDDIEVDRETKNEYEKTYEKDGAIYKEKYNKKYKEGELTAIYDNRYVLKVEGKNVKLSELEDARDKVKIRKLQ